MEDIELLVHITAAAGRHDDNRFLDLAQSVLDFKPATVTKVTDSEHGAPITTTEESSSQTHLLFSSSESDDCHNHSPTPVAPQFLRGPSPSKPGQTSPAKGDGSKGHRRQSTENPNSPDRNPYHGPPVIEKPKSLYTTPNHSRRPQTAPEQVTNTVQVPRTAIKRVQSDSTSFGSLASHISNSQPSEKRGDDRTRNFNATVIPSSLRGGCPQHRNARSFSETALDNDHRPHKWRKTLDHAEIGMSRVPRPPGTDAFFLMDRSLEWTSSPQSSQDPSSLISSTATPSQPLQGARLEIESEPASPQPIIFISSDSSKQAEVTEHQHQEESSNNTEHQLLDSGSKSGSVQETSQRAARSLVFDKHGLEAEVAAPAPNVGEERFSTHITQALRDFASQLPFARFFRPVKVARDVKVLERGHWLMYITLVSDEVAEAARFAARHEKQGPTMLERFQGATAADRLRKYDEAKRDGSLHAFGQSSESKAQGLWTEDELVQFWKSFSSFIGNGKAGWGTRLVCEELSGQVPEERQPHESRLRIRIFTWGECIGHIYLAVWILSDKLAARIPMIWIAGNGEQVVRMAGTRSGRGSLPEWVRKGSEGEKGYWGVAEEI
jgi:hypothetical protein